MTQENNCDYDVIIVGGGIAGFACGVALARKGIRNIKIYEKARSLQPTGAALGLFPNGFAALREISPIVDEKIRASAIPASKMQMKSLDGSLLKEIDLKASPAVLPSFLVWYLLQDYLREGLPEGVLSLGHMFESCEVNDQIVRVRTLNRLENNAVETKTCRVLIGADGIKSTVRTALFGVRPMSYHGKMMFRAVMNLDTIDPGTCPPAGTSVSYQGEEKGKLFAFRETAKGILTVTAMALFNQPDLISSSAEDRKERLLKLFEGYPSDVKHVIEQMPPSSLYENAIHDIAVEEEWSKGPVVLIGDAAHAMTPGMGQGANQGLEDACELATVLARALHDENDANLSSVLEGFWKSRIDRVREIHAASRARTQSINQISSTNKKAAYADATDPSTFLDRLYQWKPTNMVV